MAEIGCIVDSVANRRRFDADPDPNFHVAAVPDPDPNWHQNDVVPNVDPTFSVKKS
jgi:hypothetical protein